ncbi:MAG: endonuclease [Arcobacteraceae bacterium]|nr:endonuclease [Arcobacteraceae bacterium]
MFKKLLIVCFLVVSSFGYDKIYFLPNESKIAQKEIVELIENAKLNIDIVMYNIDYKKFEKALKKASKNGVNVSVVYEKSKLKFHKNIKLIKTKRKLHIKLAIIDNKFAIYGSANWKKESFEENYEIINITDEEEKIKKFQQIVEQIKREN